MCHIALHCLSEQYHVSIAVVCHIILADMESVTFLYWCMRFATQYSWITTLIYTIIWGALRLSIKKFIFLQIEHFVKMNETKHERQFKCEDCKKMFTRKTTQRDHHARMHKNDLRYSCFVCKKGFYDKAGMRKHLAVHDDARQNRSELSQLFDLFIPLFFSMILASLFST